MRELKFRRPYYKGGKFERLAYWQVYRKFASIPNPSDTDIIKPDEQYIGIKDSEGNEIYEGDIVEHKGNRYIIAWKQEICAYVIVKPEDGWYRLRVILDDVFKVIGNIHQIPEMIK